MGFVVKKETVRYPGKKMFEHCGRMFLLGEFLRVVLDGKGMYDINLNEVRALLLGLGEAEIFEAEKRGSIGTAGLSESRKGFYMTIAGRNYVTPAERVKRVLNGDHRKAAVFLVEERSMVS